MTKITKKAILSAKDSVKNAREKMIKIAQDMVDQESAPSPEQVKEIVESIGSVAQEIEQQADMVAEGLEGVTDGGDDDPEKIEGMDDDPEKNGKPKPPVVDEETKRKMEAQEEKIKELEDFKETNEKEKMAKDFAALFPPAQRNAKFNEFMKMEKPNSELKTVLSATEKALTSLTKNASMRKSNETIIFNESKQKQASMGGLGTYASSLSEI